MFSEVVVTGIGTVTPLGLSALETWRNLISGKSAIKKKNGYLVAEVAKDYLPDRTYFMLQNAVSEAISDAKISEGFNVAFVLSQSKPDIKVFEDFLENIVGNIGLKVASDFNFKHKSIKNVVAACATGLHSIYSGINMLKNGLCDICVIGVAESSLNEFYLSAFKNMGVLSKSTMRPFDEKRDGFAVGEGAGACVIEKETSALKRGAKIYCQINSCVVSSALDVINFKNSVKIISHTIKKAKPEGIDYINAHGTATRVNDEVEVAALCDAFGDTIYDIPISSTKAATGHLLGASGIVEFIFCILAVKYGVIPPTLNLVRAITNLNFVPEVSIKKEIKNAMSLSYGFGGQVGVICCGVCE